MDNKQFKKILKESLSTGASFLFEEEDGTDEETVTDEEDSSNLTEMAKQLLALIDISKNDLETIKASNKLDDDSFAKAMAYYYVARYYDDQENFSMSLNTPRDFDRSIKFVLQEIEKAAENVVCFFDEVVMWSTKSKMYANPQSFVEKLQQKTGKETFRAIASKLSDNHKNKFQISSSNSSLLKKLIAALPKDFDLSKCADSKAKVPQEKKKTRTKEQQPMSLESLKAIIKKTDAMDYATKIITALKQDMEDLRVRVNEAREKTPLLTNTIKVLQSIPDKEIQKAALKSILDFFKVNKLQIDDKTKSSLVKSDILNIQQRAGQKVQEEPPEEEVEEEEAEEEETEDEAEEEVIDLQTPETKQALAIFRNEIDKVPVIKYYTDEITKVIMNIAPARKIGRIAIDPASLQEESEVDFIIKDAEALLELLLKIKEERTIIAAKIAYIIISRFLTRNGMKINDRELSQIKRYNLMPSSAEEAIKLLKNVEGRKLEEQRYNMLLKRFDIK